jgi:hypothetical protein
MEGIHKRFLFNTSMSTLLSGLDTGYATNQVISFDDDDTPKTGGNNNFITKFDNVRFSVPEGRYLIHLHLKASNTVDARCNLRTKIAKEVVNIFEGEAPEYSIEYIKGSYGSGYKKDATSGQLSSDSWCIVDMNGLDTIRAYLDVADHKSANISPSESYIEFIRLDENNDFAYYSDNEDERVLADVENTEFDVYWGLTESSSGTSIGITGSNSEIITLQPNKYLIICNVNFLQPIGAEERTSRTIYPNSNLISGLNTHNPIPGIVGDEYMQSSAARYGSPNFLFIHETISNEEIIIKSVGPYVDTNSLSNVSIGGTYPAPGASRELNTSGIFIYQLNDDVRYSKFVQTTYQDIAPIQTTVNLSLYDSNPINYGRLFYTTTNNYLIADGGGNNYFRTNISGSHPIKSLEIDFYITSAVVSNSNTNRRIICGDSVFRSYIFMGNVTGSTNFETIGFVGDVNTAVVYINESELSTIEAGFHNFLIEWNGTSYDLTLDGKKYTTFSTGTGQAVLPSGEYNIMRRPNNSLPMLEGDYVSKLKIINSSDVTVVDFENRNLPNGSNYSVNDSVFTVFNGISIPQETGLNLNRNMRAFIYSQIYARMDTYYSTNLDPVARGLNIKINNISLSKHEGFTFIRLSEGSLDNVQGTYQSSGVFDINYGDQIRFDSNIAGSNGVTVSTVEDFPPTAFLLDLVSLQPKQYDLSTEQLTTNFNAMKSGTDKTKFNRGFGDWAASTGIYDMKLNNVTTTSQIDIKSNISMGEIQNYYTRYTNSTKRDALNSVTNQYYFIPHTDTYQATIHLNDTEVSLFGLNSISKILEGGNTASDVISLGTLNEGDILESNKPITINKTDHPHISALYSKWSGYSFALSDAGKINIPASGFVSIYVFTLDNDTNVKIKSTHTGFLNGDIKYITQKFSYHIFTYNITSSSNVRNIHFVSADKPIICGIYTSDDDFGYQGYPMSYGEDLFGAAIDTKLMITSVSQDPSFYTYSGTVSINGLDSATFDLDNTNSIDDGYVSNPAIVGADFNKANIINSNELLLSAHAIESTSDSLSIPYVSLEAGGTGYVFHTNILNMIIVSNSSVSVKFYNSNNYLYYQQSLSLETTGVYKLQIDNGTTIPLNKNSYIITSDFVNVWATDTNGKSFYLHGTSNTTDLGATPSLNTSLVSDDLDAGLACEGTRNLTIYHDGTNIGNSTYFYRDNIGTPLELLYYSDGTNVVEGNNSSFILTPQSCF